MRSSVLIAAIAVSCVGFAGTYSGKGKTILGGKVEVDYTTTLAIEIIEKDKVFQLDELTKLANGEVINESHRLVIGDKGVATILKGDVLIGTGYCIRQEEGGNWCDYRAQTAAGLLHQNYYHDTKNEIIHRVGDMTSNEGNGFWSDTLILEKQ